MTITDLVAQAQIRDRGEDGGLSTLDLNTNRTLEGYLYLAVSHLQEALSAKRHGRRARPHAGYGEDNYQPEAGEPAGWGNDIAEAVLVLAACCRQNRVPLEKLLEQKTAKGRKR